jgi:hypothetical protein
MMMNANVNYLAVIAASVSVMVVGFAWYSQPVFGRLWGWESELCSLAGDNTRAHDPLFLIQCTLKLKT